MKKLLLWVLIFLSASSNKISGQTLFQRTYGGAYDDEIHSCMKVADGNYVIVGDAIDSLQRRGIYVVKLDTAGNKMWEKNYYPLICGKAKPTPDGGLIICGHVGNGMNYNINIVLLKTDSLGDTLWTKSFSGPGPAYYTAYAYDVILTSDGGYAVVGSEVSGNNTNMYLVKTDGNGNKQWSKSYGGSLTDWGFAIQQTPDDGYVLAGQTYGLGQGTYEVYIVRTDASGGLVWTKTYGGTRIESAYDIQNTSDLGFILTGKTSGYGFGTIYDDDLFLMKIDSTGNSVWAQVYGGIENEEGRAVKQTSDGGYVATGYSKSSGAGATDVYLLKTDNVGNLQWSKVLGGAADDKGYDVLQDGATYLIAGATRNFSHGLNDYYLVRTDSSGNSFCNSSSALTYQSPLTWTQGSGGSDSVVGTVKSNALNVTILSTTDFDPCNCMPPVATFQTSWIDGCANFLDYSTWADNWFWDFGDFDTSTSEDPMHCYVTGYYTVCLTVTNACGISTFCDSFLVEVGINEVGIGEEYFSVYPNPSKGKATFRFSNIEKSKSELSIYNMIGVLQKKYISETGEGTISISDIELNPGIYLCELKNEIGKTSNLRLVVLK